MRDTRSGFTRRPCLCVYVSTFFFLQLLIAIFLEEMYYWSTLLRISGSLYHRYDYCSVIELQVFFFLFLLRIVAIPNPLSWRVVLFHSLDRISSIENRSDIGGCHWSANSLTIAACHAVSYFFIGKRTRNERIFKFVTRDTSTVDLGSSSRDRFGARPKFIVSDD